MNRLKEEEDHAVAPSPMTTSFPSNVFSSAPAQAALVSNTSPFGSSTFSFNGPSSPTTTSATLVEDDSESTDNQRPLPDIPRHYAGGRRTSVSAESINPEATLSDNWTPPHHAKTAEQLSRLKAAVVSNLLFKQLEEEQLTLVLNALVEKPIPAKGIQIIRQGDQGDYFYVVESGVFEVWINKSGSLETGPDGLGEKVGEIKPGGSFGELALMYNAPRAATIVSTERDSLLWALDRLTFRRILMDAAFNRRRMHETFLEEVPLLSGLKSYERSKIADALETKTFDEGETIIQEGDAGDAFYLVEEGNAAVYKNETKYKVLQKYTKGGYFGELALLDDAPRAASVVAGEGGCKVAMLSKDGFRRLLGPLEERMRRDDPRLRG